MSRLFGASASDRVDFGSASVIDNLPAGTTTWLFRIYRTTTGNNQFMVTKDISGNSGRLEMNDFSGTGAIAGTVKRSINTDNITSTSDTTAVNTWTDVMVTYDNAAGTTLRIFKAAAGKLLVESGYGSGVGGSGSEADDSANSLLVGNLGTANPFLGRIQYVALFNRVLSVAEATMWFRHPSMISGCVFISHLGAASTEPDYSGNGSAGTVTGATQADDAPLPRTRI